MQNVSRISSSLVPSGALLVAKHTWNETGFATLESATDAVAQCGVVGDGVTDDSSKLQACINQHPQVIVEFPIR